MSATQEPPQLRPMTIQQHWCWETWHSLQQHNPTRFRRADFTLRQGTWAVHPALLLLHKNLGNTGTTVELFPAIGMIVSRKNRPDVEVTIIFKEDRIEVRRRPPRESNLPISAAASCEDSRARTDVIELSDPDAPTLEDLLKKRFRLACPEVEPPGPPDGYRYGTVG